MTRATVGRGLRRDAYARRGARAGVRLRAAVVQRRHALEPLGAVEAVCSQLNSLAESQDSKVKVSTPCWPMATVSVCRS
jgi:hypothetical protein